MATILPAPETQWIDQNGNPIAGGTIDTFIPNTSSPKTTWQDSEQTVQNTNPIVLDAAGRAIIYGSGVYRFVVKDASGNLVYDQLTADTATGGIANGGTSTGTPNAQVVAASSFSSQDGQVLVFIAGFTNTDPLTINPGGAGAIPVLLDSSAGPVPLSGGEVVEDNQVMVVYEASRGAFHIINPTIGTFSGVTITGSSISTSTILLKQSAAPTPTTEGDIQWDTDDNAIVVGDGVAQKRFYATQGVPSFACGQFQYVSTTSVKLAPFNGNLVAFPSGAVAVIGSSGISSTITSAYLNGVAGQSLAATTLYFGYLWNQGSVASPTYVIDWSTTGHATDTATGIEIKSGDATRVLIGMIRTNAGPVIADTAAARLVASWHNRRLVRLSNKFSTDRSTTSTSFTEINSEIRCTFVTWGDALEAQYSGGAASAAGSTNVIGGPSIDSATSDGSFVATRVSTTTTGNSLSTSGALLPSEGYHYLTYMGAVSSGTGVWDTSSSQSYLSGIVRI